MLEVIDTRATAINQEHELFQQSMRTGLEHAIRCGELLVEAKGFTGWGDWMDWVKSNCAFGQSMAEKYMKLATNSERVTNLPQGTSIREALRILSTPKEKRIQPQEPEVEKVTAFSWIRDEGIVAMDEAKTIIRNGVSRLLGTTVDVGVADYLLGNFRTWLDREIKRIDNHLE